MRLGTGFPEGPCTYADETGIDVIVEKLESLLEQYSTERYEPAPYLRELVSEGRTGKDAGTGFYEH